MLGPDMYDERARAMAGYLRFSIAGVAVVGAVAGLTAAVWTDGRSGNVWGGDASADLWVRPHTDDDVKPGDAGSTWGEGLLNLELTGVVVSGETYSLAVDVYNAGPAHLDIDFTAAPGHGAPAWADLPEAISSTDGLVTLPPDSKTTYTIELDTTRLSSDFPAPDFGGAGFTIVAAYSGEVAAE